MADLPRITAAHLLDTYLQFPDSIRRDTGAASFTISLSIINYYLGDNWLQTHLNPLLNKPGFMRLKLIDQAATSFIQAFKTVDMGELLFNLQNIEGFDALVERMKTEAQVESGLAELDFGRMLFINNHKFRFVRPSGVRGNDYDFEINFDKWTLCADVKCKLDEKQLSKGIIKNELSNSRTQLPPDKPGIFFIKAPQHWTRKFLFEQILVEAAKEFLCTTERVVSIKYYIAPYEVRNGLLQQGHEFKEIDNPRHRFEGLRRCELFSYRPPLGALDALPPKWRRLYDFPNGFLKHDHDFTI